MAQTKNAEILLESGTNELEIMEFTISGHSFGINVAKLTEIRRYEEIKEMPGSHPDIEGVFKPRDRIITVINLPTYLGLAQKETNDRDMLLITGFNKMNVAFHVHTVEGIHRVSWANIEKPDSTIYGGNEGLATGIAKVDGRLINIVDFEKIVFDISPSTGIQLSEISMLGPRERSEKPLVIAEDSTLLQRMLFEALSEAGYTNTRIFTNGEEAWNYVFSVKEGEGDLLDRVSCIITDIEMPKMDGHRFTKLVKDDTVLREIPVIIFSSLIDDQMREKGEQIGANAQLTKPEIGNLVSTIDKFLDQ